MFTYCRILSKLASDFCNNCVWRHHINICSFNEIDVHEKESESSSRQYTTPFTSKRRINNRNNSEALVNVFDYLPTRRAEPRFIAVSPTMFTFNATSSASTIKRNDALFVSSDSVKNAQEKKNIFYNAIESFVQDVTAILSNTRSINADDFENASAMSSFKTFSTLPPVRPTISNPTFDSSLALNRLYAYRYTQWRDSKKEYSDVEWKNLRQWKIDYRCH